MLISFLSYFGAVFCISFLKDNFVYNKHNIFRTNKLLHTNVLSIYGLINIKFQLTISLKLNKTDRPLETYSGISWKNGWGGGRGEGRPFAFDQINFLNK